jgi:molybdopterin-guanine dinucleotide biosynthesis adapter protein
MNNDKVPILGFAAASGTGKTTLLTQLIPLLKAQGWRIGLIKHSHHNIQIDQPGKDSYRLREAGASPVMLVSSHRRAIITEFDEIKEPILEEQLLAFDQSQLDLILVEGFKQSRIPKIELHRQALATDFRFPNDPDIIAVASDVQLELPTTLQRLDLNRPEQIARFIIDHFLS